MTLFNKGAFKLHSGRLSCYKIDCDALTDDDIQALALMVLYLVPEFCQVEGVPRGGLRLVEALKPHCKPVGKLLIVDDVFTTGESMTLQRRDRIDGTVGVVIFARAVCPDWIKPIFLIHQNLRSI